MALFPGLRAAAFAIAMSVLAMLPGFAWAADDGPTCCIERVSAGDPLAPGRAFRVIPSAPAPAAAPALKLTLKVVVEVEVRRVFRTRPAPPLAPAQPGAPAPSEVPAER